MMGLRPPDIIVFFEISILSLALFSILFMLMRDRRTFFWAIVCMSSIVIFSIGKIMTHPNFHAYRTPFIAIPAWRLVLPPALYLFIRQLLGKPSISKRKIVLHFLPFLCFYAFFLLPILLRPTAPLDSPLPPNGPPPRFGLLFLSSLVVVYSYYFFSIFRMVNRHKKEYVHFFSSSDNYNTLRWIKRLTLILLVSFLSNILLILVQPPIPPIPEKLSPFFFFALSLSHFFHLGIVFFLGLFIVNQPLLFPNNWKDKLDKVTDSGTITVSQKKIKQASVSKEVIPSKLHTFSEDALAMITHLETYMKTAEPYLQPKLKIADLAKKIGTTSHYLSKLINDYYGYNFFYFVNHYRINYACELLKKREAELFTIEGIGMQSGFNSRGRFIDWFKKMKGLSPSEYRKGNIKTIESG